MVLAVCIASIRSKHLCLTAALGCAPFLPAPLTPRAHDVLLLQGAFAGADKVKLVILPDQQQQQKD